MRLKDAIIDTVIIGMSAALLWHFANIWLYGQYLVKEPNIAVRTAETAGLVAILVLGISKFISDLKRKVK